jgi:hypothetical protein
MHTTQGYLAIKKGDFFPLFWDAWISSFKKETVLKSFEATGIWPKDPEKILKRFYYTPRDNENFLPVTPPPDTSDWRHIRLIARAAVKDMESAEAKELIYSLYGMQVKADLTTFENEGLRYALEVRKTQRTKGKSLNLQQRKEYRGSAVMWSPRKFRESCVREAVRLKQVEEEKLQKRDRKEMKANAILYRKQQANEKQEARKLVQEERRKEKEKKAQEVAERKQQKEKEMRAAETRKIAQSSQITPATTSKKQVPKRKRVERCTGTVSGGQGGESSQAPPTKVTRTGRNITIPKKFR